MEGWLYGASCCECWAGGGRVWRPTGRALVRGGVGAPMDSGLWWRVTAGVVTVVLAGVR